MIAIKLNGQTVNLTQSVSLKLFLEQNNLANTSGIAVALNQSVVQRENWDAIELKDTDEIIIITATQGG